MARSMSRLQAVIHNGQTADGDLYFSIFITCANKVVHRDENENRASSRAREKKITLIMKLFPIF
jgi:hypothetical protein